MSFAMVNHRITAQEALNATTINGAYAMGISNIAGSIAKGKKANFFITKKIPTLEYFPYSYGNELIEKVILNGKIIEN
jgi:imidazolonepropionase